MIIYRHSFLNNHFLTIIRDHLIILLGSCPLFSKENTNDFFYGIFTKKYTVGMPSSMVAPKNILTSPFVASFTCANTAGYVKKSVSFIPYFTQEKY
jgi:hypothetical protein